MRVTLWGTRGSLATPGPETVRYGGNTSCVEVRGREGTFLVLDAGTGIRRLGATIEPDIKRVDILLTHLHMDHIQGLGFFKPLDQPGQEVHIWGPPSTTLDLRARLARYLSPPLFPVRLRELPCRLVLHDVFLEGFEVGEFKILANLVCHPGQTVGYRITEGTKSMAYLPDHEPALGAQQFPPKESDWLSGFNLAEGVDLLIHDAQYTPTEYPQRIGWGHSAISHTLGFARMANVNQLVTFHHDPGHDDLMLDQIIEEVNNSSTLPFQLIPGTEGTTFEL